MLYVPNLRVDRVRDGNLARNVAVEVVRGARDGDREARVLANRNGRCVDRDDRGRHVAARLAVAAEADVARAHKRADRVRARRIGRAVVLAGIGARALVNVADFNVDRLVLRLVASGVRDAVRHRVPPGEGRVDVAHDLNLRRNVAVVVVRRARDRDSEHVVLVNVDLERRGHNDGGRDVGARLAVAGEAVVADAVVRRLAVDAVGVPVALGRVEVRLGERALVNVLHRHDARRRPDVAGGVRRRICERVVTGRVRVDGALHRDALRDVAVLVVARGCAGVRERRELLDDDGGLALELNLRRSNVVAGHTVSTEAIVALALKAADRVLARRKVVAVVLPRGGLLGALVDVRDNRLDGEDARVARRVRRRERQRVLARDSRVDAARALDRRRDVAVEVVRGARD
eukprot:Opistho-1_new@72018